MTMTILRSLCMGVAALFGATALANAQTVTFEITGDAKRGGYIGDMSTQAGNVLHIGLDPSDSLSTGILDPTAFSSSRVSSDTVMMRVTAPAGFIIRRMLIRQSFYRFTSRGGVVGNRSSVIIDGTPFLSMSEATVDLSERNKGEMDLVLTTFLWGHASLGSALIRIESASIEVQLAPAQ